MKNCIRIPRILLPEEGFEKWSVVASDCFSSDRAYWERVAHFVGEEPSALNLILPEVYAGEEDEERIAAIRENLYRALEEGHVTKLNRGLVFTERTLAAGKRHGIVAAFDLEAYTWKRGELSPVRAATEIIPSRLALKTELRRSAPIEFTHAVVLYCDKKNRAVKELLGEELTGLYGFKLMENGGRLTGYFVPDYVAQDVVQDLYSRGDPSFIVIDGNHSAAAAKAHWEEVKSGLSGTEMRNHPARFMLAEFVNLYEDALILRPKHRLLKEIEPEAFCDFFTKNCKSIRKGNVLALTQPFSAAAVEETDALIAEFIRANGGRAEYVAGERFFELAKDGSSAGVALPPIEKEEVFKYVKDGGLFPPKTFSFGEEREHRYYTEGREISYD